MTTMIDICDNEYDVFFALPNVNGVGIGYKEVNGINTYELCLKIMVIKKVSLDELNEDEVVPKIYKGFVTDIVEGGELDLAADGQRYRPAPGGCQINRAGSGGLGTLGCLVSNKSGTDLTTYLLTNNHVIGGGPIGNPILQPGGAIIANSIANLTANVPPVTVPTNQNLVDAAIAKVNSPTITTRTILEIGNITGIASAQLGGIVRKRGRTSEYTTGTIIAINMTVGVSGGAVYIKQILATPMSAAGDSGSIVVDEQNRVIGLLFAGGAGQNTAMNDIRFVLKTFRARLV